LAAENESYFWSFSKHDSERNGTDEVIESLRLHLDDLTQDVIEWIVDPANWWHFCQQVRAELKVHFVPDYPEVGFLLQYRGVALRVMHASLCNSIAWVDFITKLEKQWYEERKKLLLVYAQGKPEQLSKIEGAKTLTDIHKLFTEIVDESTPAS
jgi:hypothetical protein